jgi:hypothetical protein
LQAQSYQEKDPFKFITSSLENTFTSGLSRVQHKQDEKDSYISFPWTNILPRNRCRVRDYERDAIQVLYWGDVP